MAIKYHNRKDCYRNHHRNIAKRYRNVIITSHYHNPHLLLYKQAEHFPSGLADFRVPEV